MKRVYQRRYYASHKEELQRKSREFHRRLRVIVENVCKVFYIKNVNSISDVLRISLIDTLVKSHNR